MKTKKKDNFKTAGEQLEKHWCCLRKNDNWGEVWKFIVAILNREYHKPLTKKELAHLEKVKKLGDLM